MVGMDGCYSLIAVLSTLVAIARAVVVNVTSPTITSTDLSSITTDAPSAAVSCPYDCTILGASVVWYWYPSIITQIVATEVVVVTTQSDHLTTITSVAPATTSFPFPTFASWDVYTVNQTVLEVDSSLTITWPTPLIVGNAVSLKAQYLTSKDGKAYCTTIDRGIDDGLFTISVPETDYSRLPYVDYKVPASYKDKWSPVSGSSCVGPGGGIPSGNVPVLSLTETVTSIRASLAADHTTPSAASSHMVLSSLPQPLKTSYVPKSTPPPESSPSSSKPDPIVPSTVPVNQPGNSQPTPIPQGSENTPSVVNSQSPTSVQVTPIAGGTPPAPVGATTQDPKPGDTVVSPKPDVASTPEAPAGLQSTSLMPQVTNYPPLISTAGMVATKNSLGQYVVGSQTLTPGVPGITIDGTVVSIPPSPNNPISNEWVIPQVSPPGQDIVVVNSLTFSHGSGVNLVLGTQTIAPGSPAVDISGTPISLAASGAALVAGSSTVPITEVSASNIVLNGLTFSHGSGPNLVIGTQTITPGSPAVEISGTPISLAVSGTAVVAGSSTVALAAPSASNIVINDFTFTQGPGSDLVIGTQTITPGSPAVMVSGTPISLAVSETALIVGSSTAPYPLTTAPPSLSSANNVVTIDGLTLTQGPNSGLLIGTQTLLPGASAITISGTTSISLSPSGNSIVIDGFNSFPVPSPTGEPTILEFGGSSYTEISGSAFLIGTQTLVEGGAPITVNGTLMSLAPSGTAIQVGTQVEALTTTTQGMGVVMIRVDSLVGR